MSHFGHGKLSVVSIGGHSCVNGKLALAEKVFKVVEKPDSHWILHINALHTGEIASRLSHTFTDSHDAVVKEGPGVAIGSIWITETSRVPGVQVPQMLHSHLKNLCFLQLS